MFQTKFILIGLAALAVLATITAATLHYKSLLTEINTLTANNSRLEEALKNEKEAFKQATARIDEFSAAMERQQAALDNLAKTTEEAAEAGRKLSNVFARHDLEALLASRKSSLVLKRINDATADHYRMRDCTTGDGCGTDGPKTP